MGSTIGGTRSSLLFVGAHRTVDTEDDPSLLKMLKQFEEIDFVNTTQIALRGFELESLNEMVSEALCLPRRKTRSLAEVVHQKTLGIPLFIVEFLDALLTEKLLVHHSATGWGWDVDSIDLKKISSGVAAILACKLEQLPSEVLSAVKILSVLGSHVDRGILEVVKTHDGSDGSTLIPSLYVAQREGFLDIAGPTFTFMHETIKQAAFNLISAQDRIPVMLRIVACLLPHCNQDEEAADAYLFTTVDIVNIIGSQAVSKNPGQSRVFAQLNLYAGKKSKNFRVALDYFEAGISFLQGDYWNNQYELALSLHESAATANFAGGRHDQVAIQTNKIFSMARSFEDKFKSYCLYINVLAIGNTEKAKEQICHLLKSLGEDINPSTIDAPMAMVDFSSVKQMLSGTRKDILLQLPPMTDRNKRMAVKLMAMLVLYYNQQMTHLSGYFSCKIIRMSIQHGHCEDTVFALSVFACCTLNFLGDIQEASSLAKSALSMLRLYKSNSEELISRVYSRIYGAVLCHTQSMSKALPPLLKACRIAFGSGNAEQSIFNTTIYVLRSMQSGKKIPPLLDEVKAFALKHVSGGFNLFCTLALSSLIHKLIFHLACCQSCTQNQLNHMGILQLFLAPIYKFLSTLSGITFDPSTILPQLAAAPSEDVVQTAIAKKEVVFVRAAVVVSVGESFFLRDFAKAYKTMTLYPNFFQVLDARQQLRITEFEFIFIGGMLSFQWARERREVHWIQRGMNAVAAYEDWAKINPWDCSHRYHMLKAESQHTQGDTNGAIESFHAAIASAKKHNHSSHEALASEFAAHFYDSIGNTEKTKELIQKSHDAYMKWGAAKKAESVIKLLQVVPSIDPSTSSARPPAMSYLSR